MKIYDISVPIHKAMHTYPGDPRFRMRPMQSLETGHGYALHKISMGTHTGTHIDAPAHFVANGLTMDKIPLEILNGRARVIEIHDTERIERHALEQLVSVDDFRILFKTKNSLLWNSHKHFAKNYVYLTPEGAEYLVEKAIKLVGIDYLSIERFGDTAFAAHKTLLQSGIVIIEGLNLSDVEQDTYEMACLPLALTGVEAAPARVILKK
jgi:arylformamidase